ncbi:hypothetical protein SBDP1_830025 [Syntrophobacter sp. SbD1]|nr:hypothetical protein SBDP1_830025 [Syntrophobacter sp. SbD1]
MSQFIFQPIPRPFPLWMGPFSPARGMRSGFRFHQGRLGTWVTDDDCTGFWAVADGDGVRLLAKLVRDQWGGGRVLLLPNGFIVKPLQSDEEVGRRVLIGLFQGAIVLERPDRSKLDLSHPGAVRPGDPWPGPMTTGLECAIRQDGALACTWYHPTNWGRDEFSEMLRKPDRVLAASFRAARPRDTGGRVRITANGHIITNRQEANGAWAPFYVGHVDPQSWSGWDRWINKERI